MTAEAKFTSLFSVFFPLRRRKSVTRSHTLAKNINAPPAAACPRPAGQCPPLSGCYSRETLRRQRNIHLQERKSLPDNSLSPFNEGLHNRAPSALKQALILKPAPAAAAGLRRRSQAFVIFPPGTFRVASILSDTTHDEYRPPA